MSVSLYDVTSVPPALPRADGPPSATRLAGSLSSFLLYQSCPHERDVESGFSTAWRPCIRSGATRKLR
jgi:hypothetical protein